MKEQKELPSYLLRMHAEHEKLVSDVSKLDAYIYSGDTNYSALDKNEQKRIVKQLFYMDGYRHVLGKRIDAALTKFNT